MRERLVLPAAICKGGRSRTLPLNREARQAVASLLQFKEQRGFALAGPLLVGRNHQRLPAREVQRMMQKYREVAGLSPITPHSLRHFFAGRVLEIGGHPPQLQQLLGHRRLNTVEVYSYNAPEDLAKVVSRYRYGRSPAAKVHSVVPSTHRPGAPGSIPEWRWAISRREEA